MSTVTKKGTGGPIRQGFRKCPACRKNNGFYVFLMAKNGNRASEFNVRLVCPKCERVFQMGLLIDANQKQGKKSGKKK